MPSPLFNAICAHDYVTAKMLIESGEVNIHRKEDDGMKEPVTPLELLDQLNAESPDHIFYTEQVKRRPKYQAFRSFLQQEILNTFLDTLGRVYGRSGVIAPWHFSKVLENYGNSIDLLIANKPTLTNKRGWNILHFIAKSDNVELLNSLKNKVAPAVFKSLINQKTNSSGYTPLMMAIDQGNFPMARALIQANASLDVQDNEGKTALDHLTKYSEKVSLKDNPETSQEILNTNALLSQYAKRQAPASAASSSFSAIEGALARQDNNSNSNESGPVINKSQSRFTNILTKLENTHRDLSKFPSADFKKILTYIKGGADPGVLSKRGRNVLHYLYILGTPEQRDIFKKAIPADVFAALEMQVDRYAKRPAESLSANVGASSSSQANAQTESTYPLHDAIQTGKYAQASLITSGAEGSSRPSGAADSHDNLVGNPMRSFRK